MSGHFLALLIRFAGSVVLTRIFAPDVFGVLAIVWAVQIVIALLTDIGLRQVVIQNPHGANVSFLNTAWTLQILRGFLVWSLGAVFAVLLSIVGKQGWLTNQSVYAFPDLPLLITAASFSAVIVGFQSMKAVTANRDLNLKHITIIELLAQIISLFTAGVLGWETRSIWSYVAGALVGSVASVVLSHSWLIGARDKIGWDRNALRELARFGKWTFFSSAVAALAMNGDRLMLGGWVSAPMLGYYSIASNLTSIAENLAGRVFGAVSLPALSEVARLQPHRFAEIYFRIRWVTDSVLLVSAGFLFASGVDIVALLYDARYSSAGWMLQWLSFGLVFARYGVAQSAYLSLGHPEYVTAVNVAKLASLFTFVPLLFSTFGLRGAILGISFHMLPSTIWMLYFNRRLKLNSVFLEIVVLGTWPIGWLLGLAFIGVVVRMKSFLVVHF